MDYAYWKDVWKIHQFNLWTLVIALLAAGCAGWAAYEAHMTRIGADKAAAEQKADVERSRKAAENSASAAQQLANSTLQLVTSSSRSANAAEDSSQTAKQSLTEQRLMFSRAHRATFVMADTVLTRSLAAETPVEVVTTLRNVGTIPAEKTYTVIWVRSLFASDDLLFDNTPVVGSGSHSVVGPGGSVELRSNIATISGLQLANILNGASILYAYGYVQYSDENTPVHCLTFCLRFDPRLNREHEPWMSCARYNESFDRPCK